MNLRRCPCGKVPTGLSLGAYYGKKFAIPNCCRRWVIEFSITIGNPSAARQAAAQAWNDMPREGE